MTLQCDAGIEPLLRGRRTAVLAAWRELILASYPEPTARFLRREHDRFRNPMGHRINEGTAILLEGLAVGRSPQDLASALDAIVRPRAVQGGDAAQAVSFVFLLKRALRDVLGDELSLDTWVRLDQRVDALALAAVDVYARCRDEIHEIRVREAQRRVATLIERWCETGEAAAVSVGVRASGPAEDGGRP